MMLHMSRDPLGLDPIQHIQEVVNPGGARAISALKQGVITQDVTVVPHARTPEERAAAAALPGAPVIGDDGAPLTYEDRVRIAAARKPVVDELGNVDFSKDLVDRVVAPLGTAAQKIIAAQPTYRIHPKSEAIVGEEP